MFQHVLVFMDKIHVIDVTPITTNLEFPLYKVVERIQVPGRNLLTF